VLVDGSAVAIRGAARVAGATPGSSAPALHSVERSEHETAREQAPYNRDDRGAFDGRQRRDDHACDRGRE
jgi:hypothetical protein